MNWELKRQWNVHYFKKSSLKVWHSQQMCWWARILSHCMVQMWPLTFFFNKANFSFYSLIFYNIKDLQIKEYINNIRNSDSVFLITTLVKDEYLSSLLSWGSWVLVKRALFEYLILWILNYVMLSRGIGMVLEFYRSLSDWSFVSFCTSGNKSFNLFWSKED